MLAFMSSRSYIFFSELIIYHYISHTIYIEKYNKYVVVKETEKTDNGSLSQNSFDVVFYSL